MALPKDDEGIREGDLEVEGGDVSTKREIL